MVNQSSLRCLLIVEFNAVGVGLLENLLHSGRPYWLATGLCPDDVTLFKSHFFFWIIMERMETRLSSNQILSQVLEKGY